MPSKLKESIASKKLLFSLFSVGIGFLFAVIAATKLPELKSMFETFTGLVEFICASYLGGNVLNKYVLGNSKNKAKSTKTKEQQAPKP